MQASQPTVRHEIILHMRRNERTSEDRKLKALKERLVTIKRGPTIQVPRESCQA